MNAANGFCDDLRGPGDVKMENRRTEERRVIDGETVYLEIDGKTSQFAAVACDAGTNSVGIISQIPIKVGSHIRICMGNNAEQWREAQIVHCTGTCGGYKIGLMMLED
jgi:hypothetical protein